MISIQLRVPEGVASEAIRRERVKSSRVPLAALGVPGLGFTGIGVLCFSCRPSESPGETITNEKKGKTK